MASGSITLLQSVDRMSGTRLTDEPLTKFRCEPVHELVFLLAVPAGNNHHNIILFQLWLGYGRHLLHPASSGSVRQCRRAFVSIDRIGPPRYMENKVNEGVGGVAYPENASDLSA